MNNTDLLQPVCVACNHNENDIPLIAFRYKAQHFWICPQHLPILIHDPRALTGKLPGAEGMYPAEHHE